MGMPVELKRERRLEAAEGYLALDMPDHALHELEGVPDPEQCSYEVNLLRGEALRQKREHEAALRFYRRALDECPADVSVLMGMAWCYKRTGRLNLAIETMEQAYKASPDEPVVLYNLACYHALAGHKTQALSWLGRALRMEQALRKLIPAESDFDRLRDDPDFHFVAGEQSRR